MDEVSRQRLSNILSELNDLTPRFEAVVAKCDTELQSFEEKESGEELSYVEAYWVITAYRNALIKLRLILENNFRHLETLNVLATTRYVFETLVWLRLLDDQTEYGLVFYGNLIRGQLQHYRADRKKLADEIIFFERLAAEEERMSKENLRQLTENSGSVSLEQTSKTTASIMTEIDRRARRAFSLYAYGAKRNGYGFQAHLIKTKVMPQIEARIEQLESDQKAFASRCPRAVLKKQKERWNWKIQSGRVGMQSQYEYIYSFTSRLLHATPSSIFADQKNLELSEMVHFVDYIYVSMLDALDLAARQVGSDTKLN